MMQVIRVKRLFLLSNLFL